MKQNAPSIKPFFATEYLALVVAWLFWWISQGLLRIESNEVLTEGFILAVALVHAATLFFANLLFIDTFERISSGVKGTLWKYAYAILALAILALAAVFLNVTFYNWTHGRELFRYYTRYLTSGLEKMTFIAGFSTMFFLIRNLKEHQKQKSILEEAQQTARDAQLQLLQQQLNPHFLFNTLNSLRILIAIDQDRARGMVTDLSEFLRVTLASYHSVQNTLQDEVSLLDYYLKIQKTRFEEELDYVLEIEEGLLNFTVPKIVLQPLVENAVKYGMLTSSMPLRIWVSARRRGDEISLTVVNTGKLVHPSFEKHGNNGISNTQARMGLMFGSNSSFSLTEDSSLVKAEITIKNLETG